MADHIILTLRTIQGSVELVVADNPRVTANSIRHADVREIAGMVANDAGCVDAGQLAGFKSTAGTVADGAVSAVRPGSHAGGHAIAGIVVDPAFAAASGAPTGALDIAGAVTDDAATGRVEPSDVEAGVERIAGGVTDGAASA